MQRGDRLIVKRKGRPDRAAGVVGLQLPSESETMIGMMSGYCENFNEVLNRGTGGREFSFCTRFFSPVLVCNSCANRPDNMSISKKRKNAISAEL